MPRLPGMCSQQRIRSSSDSAGIEAGIACVCVERWWRGSLRKGVVWQAVGALLSSMAWLWCSGHITCDELMQCTVWGQELVA